MGDSCWVFGLSLDEKVEWSFSKAFKENESWIISVDPKDRVYGNLGKTPHGSYKNNIQGELRAEFERFKQNVPSEIIDDVTSVGVSIVGLADRTNLHLVSIARKDWGKPDVFPVVDFRELFDGIFPKIDVSTPFHSINLHNESTAKCLAEWHFQDERDKVSSIFYVMFSEGVNAGFVSEGNHMHTELHTELGHIWPRPHRQDFHFDIKHSGCRIHKLCFEGLASEKRIHATWGHGRKHAHLSELSEDAWDVIAFYIAQMCINGVLTVSPKRILLGGRTIFPDLIPHIKGYFRKFNDGGTDEPYLHYPAMHSDDFIRMGQFGHEEAGIIASLELARLVLQNTSRALWAPGKRAPRKSSR